MTGSLRAGIVEIGDREITLDDIWRVDLAKRNGWVLVKDNSAGAADFEASATSSSDGSDVSR